MSLESHIFFDHFKTSNKIVKQKSNAFQTTATARISQQSLDAQYKIYGEGLK